jgi:diguanylate cyclase (GGDEF)-like protein
MSNIETRFKEVAEREAKKALGAQALEQLLEQGMESDEEHGKIVAWYFQSGDQEGLKSYIRSREKRLQELSVTDTLTGLPNRRAFDEQAEVLFAQVRNTSNLEYEFRRQLDFSLIFADVDRFKSINDTYGHAAGDAALKFVAQTLRAAVRPGDLLCRYGGEEFVIAFIGTIPGNRFVVAERCRRALENASFEYEGTNIPLTASFGAAKYQPGESLTDLITRADQAMYEAKQAGRNRVVIAEGTANE